MRKLLIFLMAMVAVTVTSPAFAAKRSIMELGGVAELAKLKPLRIEKFGLDRIFSDRV